MVQVDIPAKMVCVEPGCGREQPVTLVLLSMSGGFAFQPPQESGWQVGTPGPGGPFICRCPDHHQKLQVGPAGPRILRAEH